MRVRPAGPADAEGIAAVYAPEVRDGYATFEVEPPDAAEFRRRMAAAPRLPWLVATEPADDATVHGFAFAAPHHARAAYRWGVDVSIYLAPAARQRGLGRRLYATLLPELRELGYVRAFAIIALPNPGSIALHRSFGFTAAGVHHAAGYKHGAWRDVSWWELGLAPLPGAPAEPRPWAGPEVPPGSPATKGP